MKAQKMAAISIAGCLLLVIGCSSPGILAVRREVDKPPLMETVVVDGTYGLFVAGESQPVMEFPMHKDQPIGFKQEDQGTIRWLYAVAGDQHFPLDFAKTYEWRREP